ncbi:DNA helicase-2/ATP-dependent DNA helicase PcrA [Clostridium moniliforme]|uniref:DNA 3'-5' helicase n=1 Tax=Clostridium moniliforme TaxID=39489 RepID=A0ABS4EYA9_9CLOT|nr:DNA helicase-2/ATP-dependent DNA helicase PcrA [Clostridium moniliforme]
MNLDLFQQDAVNAKERNVLVVAAPGSGKTTVIINRINYLVNKLKIYNKNIIVITFTKSAALNMKDRYIKSFNLERAPFFGTFHGLFYKMLIRENYKIEIIESYKTHKLIEGVLKKYFDDINEDKIKEVINNISLFKNSRSNLNEFKPSLTKEIFQECYEAYSSYKKKNNLWDFDDLALKVLELLKENKELRNGYRELFKYILVDEFQDCDELQIEFLKMMNEGDKNSLFAVGDEDQCIYSFRGSKPEYMVIFNNIFKGGKKYYLSKNYRSSKNIIDGAKKVIEYNKERNKKEIIANKEDDGIIKISFPYDEKIQGEEIVDRIKALIKDNKYTYKDNIILYRTNIEAMNFIDVFTRKKIPFTLLDKEYNFFEHFICKDILTYLKLSLDPFDKEAFLKIINKPFRYVSKSNLAYVRNFNEYKDPFEILMEKKDTPPFQIKKLDDLRKDIQYLSKLSLSSAIQFIISDLGYLDYLKTYCEKFNQSLDDLEEILEEFKISASGFKTIIEFFTHIENIKEEIEMSKNKIDEDRVLLSTIHRVKGMEFKNVFLVNCNEDTIPHISAGDENIEEERRLFYVGITRAIDNLYITAPKTKGGKFKEASRFIKETEFKNEEEESHDLKKGTVVYHNGRKEEGIVDYCKGDRINILFKDGIIRSFSIKILLERNLLMIIE